MSRVHDIRRSFLSGNPTLVQRHIIDPCETAEANAETAETNAETAEAHAETAETNAETAETNAEAAQAAAVAAQGSAEGAQTAAEAAQVAAELAETNAETAETNAEAAQTAVENNLAKVTVAAAGGAGGSADGSVSVDLLGLGGAPLAKQVEIWVIWANTQYSPQVMPAPGSTVVWGAASKGTIVYSSNGSALVRTDANGEFDAAVTNAVDETLYVMATAARNVSNASYAIELLGHVAPAATWSA